MLYPGSELHCVVHLQDEYTYSAVVEIDRGAGDVINSVQDLHPVQREGLVVKASATPGLPVKGGSRPSARRNLLDHTITCAWHFFPRAAA
jgi:hypothetical protein